MKIAHLLSLVLVVAPGLSRAHFIWAYAEGNTVRLELADSPGKDIVPFKVAAQKPGQPSALHGVGVGDWRAASDGKSLVSELTGHGAATVWFTYGLHGTDLVTWYAKAAPDAAAAAKPTGQDYEVTFSKSVATVWRKGKPVSGASVEVYGPGIPAETMMKSDSHGQVKLALKGHGRLALGAIVDEPGGGTYKGKPFKARKQMATLTLQV